MYFAATLLVPVVVAVLLYFLLGPIVAWLVARSLPRAFAAVLVTSLLLGAVAGTLYGLSEPGADWLREAPASLAEFRAKLRTRPNPIAEVRDASEAVEEAVAEITGSNDDSENTTPAVEISAPGALDTVLGRVPVVAASAFVTLVLTLFLLIYGDRLLRGVVGLGRSFSSRRRIVVILRQVQRDIARYLGTVTLINIGLGFVVAGAMYWIGLPNPELWGVVAAVLNFAPYVGAAITAVTLLLVGFSTFDTTGAMLGPALLFLVITTLEGQLITPMLLGHRLELSPLIVFLSVLALGWLWGLIGALIAVPMVASIRIVLSNTPRLQRAARLLAR
jgi:predicted PurR-regulated permease PerM